MVAYQICISKIIVHLLIFINVSGRFHHNLCKIRLFGTQTFCVQKRGKMRRLRPKNKIICVFTNMPKNIRVDRSDFFFFFFFFVLYAEFRAKWFLWALFSTNFL